MVGMRGPKVSHTHFKIYDKVFKTFIYQQQLARTLPYLEHNRITALPFITKHYTPGSGPGVGLRGQILGHTYFKVLLQFFLNNHISAVTGKTLSIFAYQSFLS